MHQLGAAAGVPHTVTLQSGYSQFAPGHGLDSQTDWQTPDSQTDWQTLDSQTDWQTLDSQTDWQTPDSQRVEHISKRPQRGNTITLTFNIIRHSQTYWFSTTTTILK